jgi:Fic family protein
MPIDTHGLIQMSITSLANPAQYKFISLRIVAPEFDSDLTDLIIKLDSLKKLRLRGTTPTQIFFQIKNIFHILESLGSARIEGNRTTTIEYIDQRLESGTPNSDSFKEIENMEIALKFIEENINGASINRAFISEIHKIAVNGLQEEGSKSPGIYRDCSVTVRGSDLVPPPPTLIASLMDELFKFIENQDSAKYDLIKIALTHHRFVWIHPFDNGNGRTARLLTYALLIKFGFKVNFARILNPAAIFCCDRNEYFRALSRADQGDDEGFLLWIHYMLSGLQRELIKTDKLTDFDYLKAAILIPAIKFSLDKSIIGLNESKILGLAAEKGEIVNSDIRTMYPQKHPSDISRMIRDLVTKKYLVPIGDNKRKYTINFKDNKLIRGIIHALEKEDFLPENNAPLE